MGSEDLIVADEEDEGVEKRVHVVSASATLHTFSIFFSFSFSFSLFFLVRRRRSCSSATSLLIKPSTLVFSALFLLVLTFC